MKTKTIIIILVVVLILAAGVWIFSANKATDQTEPAAGTAAADKAQKTADSVKMPLAQGSKGDLVKAIQTALNAKYNTALKVDGDWGAKTQAALKSLSLPTTIYWKQWNEITGKSVLVGGKIVLAEKTKIADNPWLGTLPALGMLVASNPNYFM